MNLVLSYFERTCALNSKKTAVILEDYKITYETLLNNSKKTGTHLANFISINDPVIIFMDKGIKALYSFFGVLYAGGCYSLVNIEFPDIRIKQINEVLKSKIVITDDDNYIRSKKIFKNCRILKIENLIQGDYDDKILQEIMNNKIDLDPVYINFTSGSTGVPKGVVVSNRSIVDFIETFIAKFNIKENDIIANQAPFDFDVSVKDIYSSIFAGASLVIVPKNYFSSPAKLLDYLDNHEVTTLIWAVSALCLITTFHGLDYKVPTKVTKIIFSGEVMPIKHLKVWMEHLPKATFVNVYGPTEITCNCTYHIIDRSRNYDDNIPIGKPFLNEKVFLLDSNNNLVNTQDTVGEICVSGSCLSLGYFNNKEQTDKNFIENPVNSYYYERIYKTGDLGKYNANNELIFCGRKDFQIKYMGHRIELEEIDKMILNINTILRCCTLFDSKKSKLYCFYIGDISKEKLREVLNEKLPKYMIPTKLIKVSNLPLTKNGKIDRKQLFESIGDYNE